MRILKVNTKKLNLRVDQYAESRIISTLEKGEEVNFLSISKDNYWVRIERMTGQVGWAAYKYFLGVPKGEHFRKSDPKWLKIAFGELGIAMNAKPLENFRIKQYLRSCEMFPREMMSHADETIWSSAFMNWVMEKSDYEGTNSDFALDWQDWGKASVKKRGSIAVFERKVLINGKQEIFGHVGIYIKTLNSNRILILGANHFNRVSLSPFPIKTAKYSLVGFRRPITN